MGITAENLAEKYKITREDCDNYAYQTQQRWKAGQRNYIFWYLFQKCHHSSNLQYNKQKGYFGRYSCNIIFNIFSFSIANEAGYYTAEIAPIDVKSRKGKVPMTQDEHPRPQTTLEQTAKLSPVFKKGGTVTAANASVSPRDQVLNSFDDLKW